MALQRKGCSPSGPMEQIRLIAEVKRASPSRGILCPDFEPVALAKTYVRGGAAAISVLTEEKYFGGSLEHLSAIRDAVGLPLLTGGSIPRQNFTNTTALSLRGEHTCGMSHATAHPRVTPYSTQQIT